MTKNQDENIPSEHLKKKKKVSFSNLEDKNGVIGKVDELEKERDLIRARLEPIIEDLRTNRGQKIPKYPLMSRRIELGRENSSYPENFDFNIHYKVDQDHENFLRKEDLWTNQSDESNSSDEMDREGFPYHEMRYSDLLSELDVLIRTTKEQNNNIDTTLYNEKLSPKIKSNKRNINLYSLRKFNEKTTIISNMLQGRIHQSLRILSFFDPHNELLKGYDELIGVAKKIGEGGIMKVGDKQEALGELSIIPEVIADHMAYLGETKINEIGNYLDGYAMPKELQEHIKSRFNSKRPLIHLEKLFAMGYDGDSLSRCSEYYINKQLRMMRAEEERKITSPSKVDKNKATSPAKKDSPNKKLRSGSPNKGRGI